MNKIHAAIADLAVPIETLVPMPVNPRRGDVDAVAASYAEFGQLKPIIVKSNDDGTFTVVAGNHQLAAAKQLGWTKIAVVEFDGTNTSAIAFALTDNRLSELGSTDTNILFEMIGQTTDEYGDLWNSLGWDDFELAFMDNTHDETPGYTQPVILDLDSPDEQPDAIHTLLESGETELSAPAGTDLETAVTQGAPSVVANDSKTLVQYMLVFDTPEQQRKWYTFTRWLKSSAVYEGETTAERLINFIDAHANY